MDTYFSARANPWKGRFAFYFKTVLCLAVGLVLGDSTLTAQTNPPLLVTTIAGLANFGAADGTGAVAKFLYPTSVAVDSFGNVYVADTYNDTIRKVTPTGVVSTLAGLAQTPGTNDGPTTLARFNQPYGVAVDASGNVYVADTGNATIREINTNGMVTTFAGLIGTNGYRDGPILNNGIYAVFNHPYGIAVDSSSNVYVADTGNNLIRKIANGLVSTLAGDNNTNDIVQHNNFGTNNGTGSAAQFWAPYAVALDAATNVYVADYSNSLIRCITPAGVVTTIATNASPAFSNPAGIAVDSATNIYVTDYNNQIVREISGGTVFTLAGIYLSFGDGDGSYGGADATFNYPWGIAVDSAMNLYVGDSANGIIRKIAYDPLEMDWVLSTLAGPDLSYDVTGPVDGNAGQARFREPYGVAVDGASNLYVADYGNNCIREITPGGVVTTVAGSTSGLPGSADGNNNVASFSNPSGLCLDTATNIYVADFNNSTVRIITPDALHSNWVTTTIAGQVGNFSTNDGVGTNAAFNAPFAVAVDSSTNLYVTDTGNALIRMISPIGTNWVVSTYAGTNNEFSSPYGIAVDGATNLYVADYGKNTIFVVSPGGGVTPLVTNVFYPLGVALDVNTNVYVANPVANTIVAFNSAGKFQTTIAGRAGFTGSADGLGSAAQFDYPAGLSVDASGNVYVADVNNNTIRKGTPFNAGQSVVLSVSTTPAGLPISVNGTNYSSTPQILSFAIGSLFPPITAPVTNSYFTTNADLTTVTINYYLFTNWTVNGDLLSSLPVLTLINNETVTANYVPLYTCTTAVSPSDSGTVTAGGTNLFAGTTHTVTATANFGYTFIDWTVNNQVVSTSNNYTFTLAGNEVLTANFTQTFPISVTASPANGGTVTGGGTFKVGSIETVTATPMSGFVFTNWTQGGNIVSTTPSYTFTLNSNVILLANFIPLYPVSVSASPANGGTVTGGGTFASNSVVTVTATAMNGYTFTNWTTNNGIPASTNSSYAFTLVTNVTLVANFAPPNYTLSLSANPTSDGIVTGGGTFASNTMVTASVLVASNFLFIDWTNLSGNMVSSSNPYAFTLKTNQTLVAQLGSAIIVTVTNSPSNGGSSTVSSGATNGTTIGVLDGAFCTATATPNAHFAFASWSANGQSSTSNPYTFQVFNNETVTANFAPTYTVSVIAAPSNGGTVSGGGTFNSNTLVTVTAAADRGYAFINWTLGSSNGVVQNSSSSYKFTLVTNVTEVANFVTTHGQIQVFDGGTLLTNGPSASVDFGSYQITETGGSVTFLITNLGGQPLTVSNITLPVGFVFVTNSTVSLTSYPTAIPGLSNATFTVQIVTTNPGTNSGNIVITNTDLTNGVFKIPITGIVSPLAPQIQIGQGGNLIANGQAAPVNFGSVQLNQPGPVLTFIIGDSGGEPLTVAGINVPAGYLLVTNTPASISAFTSNTFSVQMETTTVGTPGGNITITNNDPTNAVFTFPITGAITNPPVTNATTKVISLSGNLAFGVTPVGTSSNATLIIGNSGNAPLNIASISYPQGFSGAWSGSIPTNGTQSVVVTFSPLSPINYRGLVTISSDATSGPTNLPISAFGATTNLVLTVLTNGSGTITPNDAKLLKLNQKISLKATPLNAQNIFVNWTGAYNTNANPLVFTMEKSTTVQANFTNNPFIPFAGTYNGLFTNENGVVTEETSGMLKGFAVTSKGTYTGTLLLNGASKSLSGSFNSTLQATNKPLAFGGQLGNVTVALTLVSNGSSLQVTGAVSSGGGMANLIAEEGASLSLSPAYTMLILPDTNISSSGGYGYASITGSPGNARTPATAKIAGYLADGTVFSQSVPVSLDSDVPIFASLYGNKGLLLGWINLTNASGSTLSWIYPAHGLFPGAPNSTNQILLSPWTSVSEAALLPTNLVEATTTGDSVVTTNFTITVSGGTLASTPSSDEVSGTITSKTGVLTVTIGKGSTKVTAHGVLLLNSTNGTNGGGYFIEKSSTGSILLGP